MVVAIAGKSPSSSGTTGLFGQVWYSSSWSRVTAMTKVDPAVSAVADDSAVMVTGEVSLPPNPAKDWAWRRDAMREIARIWRDDLSVEIILTLTPGD